MPIRTLTLATLGVLWLAAAPALAATTDQQKFVKKVARYAQPLAALDITKPRGLCTCGPNDPQVTTGGTGLLAYEIVPVLGAEIVSVSCQVPALDDVGGVVAFGICENWTLLSR